MATIAGLDTKKLAKTTIIFGLEDVLVPGRIDTTVDVRAVREILQNLIKIEEKNPDFHFFVITGHMQERGTELLKKHGLYEFCSEKKCFFVNPEYVATKEPIDRQVYEQAIAKDPFFKDEYFKQVTIEQLSQEYAIPKEKMVKVGHDLFFGAFYTARFSKIDFALIQSALSMRGAPFKQTVKGLTYINRTWPDIRKLLLGKFPPTDYSYLNNLVQNMLSRELVTPEVIGQILEAKRKHEGMENAG